MNRIPAHYEGKSFCKTYVAPGCTVVELNCEDSFCLLQSNGTLGDLDHDGFIGDDYTGGWDE